MRILVISPVVFPVGGDMRYAGIERLVHYWAGELARLGHHVTLVAASGSRPAPGVEWVEVPRGDFVQGELAAYGIYRRAVNHKLILDFSHSHLLMRDSGHPALCWVWHDPAMMQPPLPSYNVSALSHWQAYRLMLYQHVRARVVDPHCGNPGRFPPVRGERFLFIGRIGPLKGAMEAVKLCRELGVALDIVGTPGPGDPPEYLSQLLKECDEVINYVGEVNDEAKEWLLSQARALIYPLQYPVGTGEAHSHKTVDAGLSGCPIVSYRQGALPEVVDGEDGFLARSREDFKFFMLRVGDLDKEAIRARAVERWSTANVVARALPLIEQVAGGLRW